MIPNSECKHEGFWTFNEYGEYHCCQCKSRMSGGINAASKIVATTKPMTRDELLKIYGDVKEHRNKLEGIYVELVKYIGFKKRPWWKRAWRKLGVKI